MIENLPPFIKGMALSERFYSEIVRPLLLDNFPNLKHSAARIDGGSDVLGFDTGRSRDHSWGPRVMIFLDEGDLDEYSQAIIELMGNKLPFTFADYPTEFGYSPTASGGVMKISEERPINHRVSVHSIRGFFNYYLGVNPEDTIEEKHWLTMSMQCLATVVRGKVFHDGLDRLTKVQEKLNWYPKDVWIYLLACQWVRLSQEEPFSARCGDVGDELGSRIVASRQIIELMRLCFLMEKQYWPYFKWFGSAFSQLDCAAEMTPIFNQILDSSTWQEREKHLNQAYIKAAKMHNKLGITEHINPSISDFHDRHYTVIHAGRFGFALKDKINSEYLRSIKRAVGSVDQLADSTDIFCWNDALRAIGSVYDLGK